jgi:hypothetical protein
MWKINLGGIDDWRSESYKECFCILKAMKIVLFRSFVIENVSLNIPFSTFSLVMPSRPLGNFNFQHCCSSKCI